MIKLNKIFIWSAVFVLAMFGLANFSQARTWTQVGGVGLGDATNVAFYGFETIGSSFFTGSWNGTGAQAFITSDGTTWVNVDATGFGDVNNIAYDGGNTIFNGNVYFATRNTVTGTEIWATQGSSVLTASQVNVDGFGKGNLNADTHFLKEFKGGLYGGTENTTNGAEVYGYLGGTNWMQMNVSGFGDVNNGIIYAGEVFNNYLYVGTRNLITGGEIWRSANGITWTQANSDGFGVGTSNWGVVALQSFGGYLYAGVGNAAGAQIWRTSDGTNWTNTGYSGGTNTSIQGFYVVGNSMFAGTADLTNGVSILETTDGLNWTETNTKGFGSGGMLGNLAVRDFGVFGDYLYAGVANVTGGSIYRADITAPTVTASPDNKASRKKIKVTLSSNDSAGSIYYTTDGSTPTTASTKYTKKLIFEKTTILKFIGVDTEGNISSVQTKYYVVSSYPYLYNANYELQEKRGTIKFYKILTSKYGKRFTPYFSGLRFYMAADADNDDKTEVMAFSGNEIKAYTSKAKLKYNLKTVNNYVAFGATDSNYAEKTFVVDDKILKIFNKTTLVKSFGFPEKIKAVAVARAFKKDQPLIVVGFANQLKFYQYKNGSLLLKKTKDLTYGKLMAYDLSNKGLDNIMYSRNDRIYILNKKLKKKFSFKGGSDFIAVADVNRDYLLEILVSTGKQLKVYSNEGVLLSSSKKKGNWFGGRY